MQSSEEQLYEIYMRSEESSKLEDQCNKLQRKLEYIEEEACWQNGKAKKITDSLFDSYSKDIKFQRLLLEREDLWNQKIDFEKILFSNLWNMLNKERKKVEESKEWCELHLKEELEKKRAT